MGAIPRPVVSACRYCNEPILWARTENDAWIPLDPQPHPRGNVAYIAPLVRVLFGKSREEALAELGALWKPHFASCTNNKQPSAVLPAVPFEPPKLCTANRRDGQQCTAHQLRFGTEARCVVHASKHDRDRNKYMLLVEADARQGTMALLAVVGYRIAHYHRSVTHHLVTPACPLGAVHDGCCPGLCGGDA